MKRLLWGLGVASLLGAAAFSQSTGGQLMPTQTGITGFALPEGVYTAPNYGFVTGNAGLWHATPFTYLQGADASGTNAAGESLQISPGKGTGTGVGGDLYLSVAPPGTSGSSANNLQNALVISGTTGSIVLQPVTPTGGSAGYVVLTGREFSTLGTATNGSIAYCSDCATANPCAGSGTGAIAKRLAGAWVCN